jgi:prepilin-type N-terminal cleavage/methylation domain-containing protein
MRSIRENRPRRGFTLIELLVVLFIVGLLSAATLPILIPTLNQRQVQDASRVVQQALINARFAAMSTGRPAGIRLLSDAVYYGPDSSDTLRPLAFNRIMQLEAADDYSDGQLRVHSGGASEDEILDFFLACIGNGLNWRTLLVTTNPMVSKGPQDYFQNMIFPPIGPNPPIFKDPRIVLRQYKSEWTGPVPVPVEPTNWFWNLRAGDRITVGVQNVNRYVIAGPVAPILPASGYDPVTFNPERFVNLGTPQQMSLYQIDTYFRQPVNLGPATYPYYVSEILFVVNEGNRMLDGVDNNGDGFVDPAFDGRDNNGDGFIDDPAEIFFHPSIDPQTGVIATLLASGASRATMIEALKATFEWESAVLAADKLGTIGGDAQEYTVKRRMVPSANAAEVGLPADVVIDATTSVQWISNTNMPNGGYLAMAPPNVNYLQGLEMAERSRLPIDPLSRYVDIVFQPDGQVLTNTATSVNGAPFQVPFYHIWLADRGDVFPPVNPAGKSRDKYVPQLPMPEGAILGSTHDHVSDTEWQLKNQRRLITIQTRTGRITSQTVEQFDGTDPNLPFQDAQRGIAEVGQ